VVRRHYKCRRTGRSRKMNILEDITIYAEISVKDINLTNRSKYIKKAKSKFDSYDSRIWIKGRFHKLLKNEPVEFDVCGFDELTGGYVVVHKGHRFDVINGKYEMLTAIIISKNGHFVEMMNEPLRILQYDMIVNNIPSEIKVMSGFRNIHRRAVEAVEQGARRVVYYINFDDDMEMFKRFNNVYKTIVGIEEIWYVKNGKLFYFNKK